MKNQIEIAKVEFVKKYNNEKSVERALSRALNASVQHNSLYAPSVSMTERKAVRKAWIEKLVELSKEYQNGADIETFHAQVLELRDYMNRNFSEYFRNDVHPKYGYNPGFRISHAQKSLSVFLKHLWCMGMIDTPPICPVDRVILEKIGKKGKSAAWGYVNTMEEHKEKLGFIFSHIQKTNNPNVAVAVWELLEFPN
ncbi:hypothetical protein SAMN04488519_1098 [Algoriphagus ornithinivorans]|uniref:Uncharacterized protein n=1 Tax=Algoriphagus ornithinivorans TaxID=226506 RepID=A0A1I5IIJ4_9BACT|nr:hypothetical protein [Algoriphagus ornithinivorans]SFO60272.1 hypothetical protein SAMN04488519_1098 [Algoriphagus ornithinivorans]